MSERTTSFDRDVHKLHLPYLATVALLYMNPSSQHSPQILPQVYTTAISAASGITRIFRDLLARGYIRILGAIGTWYASVAIIALLQTQRIDRLAKHGREEIGTLKAALVHMSSLWPTAAIFLQGFERLKVFERLDREEMGSTDHSNNREQSAQQSDSTDPVDSYPSTFSSLPDENWMHGIYWSNYFPFVTERTSGLLFEIFSQEHEILLGDTFWNHDSTVTLQNLFGPSDNLFATPLLHDAALSF